MNKEQVQGKFDQLFGKLKEEWGKMTDNDLRLYEGKQDQFFGKLKENYGVAKEEAQKRISELEAELDKRNAA